MKQVLESYGKFLLEAVILVLLLVLLMCNVTDGMGNYGIFQIIGSYFYSEDTGWNDYGEFDSYESECSRAAPVIAYNNEGILYTGRHMLRNYIRATDSYGNPIPVKILSVMNPGGEISENPMGAGDTEINFPVAGIYSIKISATDRSNKKTVSIIKIPVNKG